MNIPRPFLPVTFRVASIAGAVAFCLSVGRICVTSAPAGKALGIEEDADSGDAPPREWLQQRYGGFANASTTKSIRTGDSSVAALSSNWRPLGPINMVDLGSTSPYEPSMGRVNCIAIDPTDANKLYLGAGSGGVWTSTDGGQNWTPRTDNLAVLGVADLKLDPQNPATIYLATGDGDGYSTPSIGVYKSTDSGVTWSPTGLTVSSTDYTQIYKLAVHPTAAGKVYAATTAGIYITSDGGASWTLVKPQGSAAPAVPYYDVKLRPDNPAIVYAAAAAGTFYRSLDGGATWTQITAGLPAAGVADRLSIGVSAANGNYVYLLAGTSSGAFNGLYQSTDGGTSFAALPANSTLTAAFGRQGYYTNSIAISPTSATDIYIGGVVPAHSPDGGTTWAMIRGSETPYYADKTITHVDVHALQFAGASLYACTDGGLHRTNDSGKTWTNLSQKLAIAQVYHFAQTDQNPSLIFAAEQDNGFNRYLNGKWEHDEIGDYSFGVINPTNANIIFSSSNGGITRSTDGGNSFQRLDSFTGEGSYFGGAPLALDPTTPTTIFAGRVNMFRSTDSGDSWQQTTAFTDFSVCQFIAVSTADPRVVYASRPYGSGNANMLRSADNGVTWTNIGAGLPSSAVSGIAIDPTNPNRLWVSLEGGTGVSVYRSQNGGASWTNFSGSLPNTGAHTIVYQRGSADRLFVGMSAGVYYRDASTNDWQLFSTGLPNAIVNDLQINNTSGTLRAGTYGRGIWETALPGFGGPGHLGNIATRLRVESGDSTAIAGFIINGPAGATKKVLIRGLGPSLQAFGVTDALADPLLELHDGSGTLLLTNDNWKTGDTSQIPSDFQHIDAHDSIIVATLPVGSDGTAKYTAVLKGVNNATGIALVEVYDLDDPTTSTVKLANIATRGLVQTGDNAIIAGLILSGSDSLNVLLRVTGPTLQNYGITNALGDPTLDLRDSNGVRITFNDNWHDTQATEISASGLQPVNDLEPAIKATLTPGNYTAVALGNSNSVGVAVVEAYQLP